VYEAPVVHRNHQLPTSKILTSGEINKRFKIKFPISFCIEIIHNLFIINSLTSIPVPGEQSRFKE
ncbi:MAG: hypothetical protein LBL62_09145, partial [Planctomycetaceae bacterium]|nr:hypothetical protein [Planctomycetaceae bacterium]